MKKQTKKMKILAWLVVMIGTSFLYGQGPIPFTVQNTSTFNDTDLYVAIVGINYNTGQHIWVDAKTSQVYPMSSSYNTLQGPTPGGNLGPGGNGKYANCFSKLSEIPNKTFTLPLIAGCRVFISKGSPMYLYFFGASGAPSGYAGHNPLNPSDPNNGILYEMIELTNNQYGFFGNPTRVDSYKYPMGLELYGNGGYFQKVGELKKHEDIAAAFIANTPAEFHGCLNPTTGEITAPSKTPAFAEGTGQYANYLKPYIDAIWNKYKTQDLIFYAGQAGVFKGRVIGEQLEMIGQSGAFVGRTGRVQYRPSTQEALEGKGVLDRRLVDGDLDLVIQAQLTAAINRHMVDVTSANPGQQNWHNIPGFYQANPMNHYAKFWHIPGISINNLSYGFAYDDVADHSPSLHTAQPTKVIAVFGGYGNSTPPIPATTDYITVYQDCNYTGHSGGLTVGDYTLTQLNALGVANDAISSIKIAQGFKVIAFQDNNFTGASVTLTADSSCLDASWNDKISSIKVVPNGVTNLGNVTYTLQNRNSNLNMDVWGASLANGANVAQGTPNNNDNQKFIFTHLGDGLYKIVAKHSNKSLDINNFNKANGANVEQYAYNATPNQQFVLVATGDGYYKIIAKHSGKLVEVSAFSTANGGNVQQWENVNQLSGYWKLIPEVVPQPSVFIQAENYSAMNGIQTEATTDTGGGQNVGWTDTGDWMAYNAINFPTSGSYLIEYRVASNVTGAKLSADLNAGSIALGTVNVPNTNGWQNWQTISHVVNVTAGTYNFGIYIQASGVNLNWIRITKVPNTTRYSSEDATNTSKEEMQDFSFYPNPVTDVIYFSEDIIGTNVTLYSVTGNLVFEKAMQEKQLEVSHLNSGIYLLVLEKNGSRITKKIVKK